MKEAILNRLRTAVIGHKLHIFDEVGSTNDVAVERARADGEEGEVFIARRQTAGRGRLGRSWESPADKNVSLSILLRPPCAPAETPLLTLVAGSAVYDTLASFLNDTDGLKLKWPNDVYFKDRKIAGILSELHFEKSHFVVVGIGIDVNADPEDFSLEVRDLAVSLKGILGKEIDLAEVVARLLGSFERRYQSFLKGQAGEIVAFCDAHSHLKGRRISFEGSNGNKSGVAIGLSPQGHLLVKKDDDTILTVASGDVILCS